MRYDDDRDGRSFDHVADPTARRSAGRLLVVVPAYNEESSIATVVSQIRECSTPCDVVVIDDGSTDATASEARAAGALVVTLPFNLGIGGAVQTGFLFAQANGYEYMAQVDGDGQHSPEALEVLLRALERDPNLDMACGSRFLTSDYAYRASTARRLGIRLFAFSLTHALHRRITDPTSGFRVWNRRAIELFAAGYPHDYPEVESLLMLHLSGLSFAEVAVPMHRRAGGRSSITSARSGYYMLKVSLALFAGLLRRPIAVAPARFEPKV